MGGPWVMLLSVIIPVRNNNSEQVKPGPSIFGKGPSIFGKCRDPPKTANFGGKKLFLVSEKIFQSGNGCAMSFLQKKMEKFRQIWPQQPLKHFTAAYRGSPLCTQSQHPINRETGYSNVLHRTLVKRESQYFPVTRRN